MCLFVLGFVVVVKCCMDKKLLYSHIDLCSSHFSGLKYRKMKTICYVSCQICIGR